MRSEEEIRERIKTCAGDVSGTSVHYILEWVLSGTQWRDAKKELPKCDCKVLVYDELGMVSDAWFLWAQHEFVHDGIVSKRVYWQPLPAPPEGV